MTDEERRLRLRLRDDLPFYAERCLHIRTKTGRVEPLVLNAAQRFIHERLEAQRAETGRVRALILKGRQQGCSTYGDLALGPSPRAPIAAPKRAQPALPLARLRASVIKVTSSSTASGCPLSVATTTLSGARLT